MQAQPFVLYHSRDEVGGPRDVVADNAKIAAAQHNDTYDDFIHGLLMKDPLVSILKSKIFISRSSYS
jgi:hypothetical protein